MVTLAARGGPARPSRSGGAPLLWLAVAAIVAASFAFRAEATWLMALPADWVLPLGAWIDGAMHWLVGRVQGLTRAVSWATDLPLVAIRDTLTWLPWPATIGVAVAIAWRGGGRPLAAFVALGLLYIVVVGYWEKAMLTLALVGVAVPISAAIGLALGVLGARSRLARRIMEPALDLAQAIPAFAYIIPILLLFGLTPTVAIVTSAIYAIPPMIRNVMLGLSRVPVEVIESATISGATSWQLLRWVELPVALPTVLLGVNQCIMAAFTLVVFTAIVGGTADIGYEVLWRLRKSQFGESLLAGIVITLFAMMVDRTGRAYARRRAAMAGARGLDRRALAAGLALVAAVLPLAELVPALRAWPAAWTVYPATELNDAVIWFTRTFYDATERIKELALYFFLLPIKAGLVASVRPEVWGFAITPAVAVAYAALVGVLAALAGLVVGWRAAVAVAALATLAAFGTLGTPWPAFLLPVTLLAFQVGGLRVAALAFGGLAYMLLTNVWAAAMMSVYLCGAAVLLCFVVGGLLGLWAAHNDAVSRVLAPVNDTLQTIPLFVFLIPVVMVFLHGDFAAVLAICMYAIVPAIRYTELGIRNVPAETVEVARAFGCTPRQALLLVKLPLALPEIMLGLNQVIVYALSMLIVTSLLGTRDLGQSIYEALTRAETGKGLVAGFAIAFLAMIADRIIQSWSNRKKTAYGLA
jgi:glycine betaine/proline transport system permease protein